MPDSPSPSPLLDGQPDSDDDANAPVKRGGRRMRNVLLGLLVCLLVLVVAGVGGAFYLQGKLSGQVERIEDAFAGLDDRPAKPTSGAGADSLNILLMGSDRRSEARTTGKAARGKSWIPGEQRSDTLMVLHVDGDRGGASLISIPRDSWVTIPGYGEGKINAAFSYGGPSLAVETVEQLTNLRIDHIAVVDWEGFRRLTDTLGGVTIDIPETVYDKARKKTWTAGEHEMDGDEALLYVRQRYGLDGGDFDRIKRQQNFLRTLMGETLSGDTMANPKRVYSVLDAVTDNLSVDEEWSVSDMRGLLVSLRGMRASDVEFTTVPLKGTGREGAQSVVYLDKRSGADLWGAVREDRAAEWIADHPDSKLGTSVS